MSISTNSKLFEKKIVRSKRVVILTLLMFLTCQTFANNYVCTEYTQMNLTVETYASPI